MLLKSASILMVLLFIKVSFAQGYGNVQAKFVRNYDGDTITVNIPSFPSIIGEKIPVRIARIDTPEIKGSCYKEKQLARRARNLVYSMLKNSSSIVLADLQRGKYFRLVANVIVNGKSVGEALIKNGLAVHYTGGRKTKNWCA